jgi:hypothetical protein
MNTQNQILYRVIEEVRPTLLIDEADTFLAGKDELRGILNSGYTRDTAYVMRVGAQGAGKGHAPDGAAGRTEEEAAWMGAGLARFSCWCPKAMVAIGRLPDTLADRSIVIRMQRKAAGEQCERLRELEGEGVARLRGQCARFVAERAGAIAEGKPQIPGSLNDRAGEIWEPLLVLADLAGGSWGSGRAGRRSG